MNKSRAAAWIAASRPHTLPLSLGAVLVGGALARGDGRARLLALSAAAVTAIALQVAANLYNDYGDFVRGADEARVGSPRAAAEGWLAAGDLRKGALAALGVGIAAGAYLVALRGWPAALIGAAAGLAALGYTAGPWPLAYAGLGDLAVVIFFGFGAVCGTYFAQTGAVTWTAAAASLATGAVASTVLVINNVRDREGDRRANKRTLVVRFGARFGHGELGALFATAFAAILAVTIASRRWRWLLPLVIAPSAFGLCRRVARSEGAALNRELERAARLCLLFDALLAFGAGS